MLNVHSKVIKPLSNVRKSKTGKNGFLLFNIFEWSEHQPDYSGVGKFYLQSQIFIGIFAKHGQNVNMIQQTNCLKLQMAPSLIYIDSSNDVETMYWLEREVLSTEMAGFLSFHELVEKPEGYQENQQ